MIRKFLSKTSRVKLGIHLLLLVLAITNILKHQLPKSGHSPIQSLMLGFSAAGQEKADQASNLFTYLWDSYVDLVNVKEENNNLKSHIKRLEEEILAFEEISLENQRLQELVEVSDTFYPTKRIFARVVAWDNSEKYRVIRVNKGSDHGLEVNDIVLASKGLVGKIIRVSANYSDVLTLLDELMRVDVLNTETRSFGMAKGTGELNQMDLSYVDLDTPVKASQKLVSSGLSQFYPKGLVIGVVEAVGESKGSLTQEISVKTAVEFDKLEEVFILKQEEI